MRIITLRQGVFLVDGNKQFKKINEEDASSYTSMSVAIQPFIVEDEDGSYILIDGGLSGNYGGSERPDLLFLLDKESIDARRIKTILISHFHIDHFSGLFHPTTRRLLLSGAEYYAYEEGVAQVVASDRYPEYTETLKDFAALDNVHLLSGEEGRINARIRYRHTAGHMPYHLVYWIEEDGDTIFYGGDEAPQLRQMQINLIAKYDYDGHQANAYRKEWYKEGKLKRWTCLFYHDIKNPIVRLDELPN